MEDLEGLVPMCCDWHYIRRTAEYMEQGAASKLSSKERICLGLELGWQCWEVPQQAGQRGGWGGKCCGGEEQHGLSPSVGQCAGCLHELWALEMLLGPQGKDRIFRKSN